MGANLRKKKIPYEKLKLFAQKFHEYFKKVANIKLEKSIKDIVAEYYKLRNETAKENNLQGYTKAIKQGMIENSKNKNDGLDDSEYVVEFCKYYVDKINKF